MEGLLVQEKDKTLFLSPTDLEKHTDLKITRIHHKQVSHFCEIELV